MYPSMIPKITLLFVCCPPFCIYVQIDQFPFHYSLHQICVYHTRTGIGSIPPLLEEVVKKFNFLNISSSASLPPYSTIRGHPSRTSTGFLPPCPRETDRSPFFTFPF